MSQTEHVTYFVEGGVPKWLRERSAKPRCSGSNPLAASTSHLISLEIPSPRPLRTKKRSGFVPKPGANP